MTSQTMLCVFVDTVFFDPTTKNVAVVYNPSGRAMLHDDVIKSK